MAALAEVKQYLRAVVEEFAHQARCGGAVHLLLVGRCCEASPNLHNHQGVLALLVKRTRSLTTPTMQLLLVLVAPAFELPWACQKAA